VNHTRRHRDCIIAICNDQSWHSRASCTRVLPAFRETDVRKTQPFGVMTGSTPVWRQIGARIAVYFAEEIFSACRGGADRRRHPSPAPWVRRGLGSPRRGSQLKHLKGDTMPRGDGMGPPESGQTGSGRMRGPSAAGPGGQCVCPKCGHTAAHVAGQPCNQRACPQCGTRMTRQ